MLLPLKPHNGLILYFCLFQFCLNGQNNCEETNCYKKELYKNNSDTISVIKIWESSHPVLSYGQTLIADMDGDGFSEIVSTEPSSFNSDLSNMLIILNGFTGEKIKSIATPYFVTADLGSFLLLDVNNDCLPEIILATSGNSNNPLSQRKKLICIDYNGNTLWIADQSYGSLLFRGGGLGSADFNLDGVPEIFIYNEIYNSSNGIKILDGGINGQGIGFRSGGINISSCIAANIDDDSYLELIAGYSVYKVFINNINGITGNSMTAINIDFNGTFLDGFTSVADIDLDGKLDIIVSPNSKFIPSQNIDIGVYCYTIENNQAVLLAKIGRYKPNTTYASDELPSI